MSPEDNIRMLMEDQAKWQAMMDNYAELELRNRRFSDAEREEAQAKYLRRLQKPFVYRPGPSMSEEEIAEMERIQEDLRRPIAYKMPYGPTQADGPPLPYDFRGM